MRRASGRKLRPAGVSRTERLVRSSSGASMMCSSTWICRRERRLGHVEPRRGAAEMQFLGHGDEAAELAEIEHRYMP